MFKKVSFTLLFVAGAGFLPAFAAEQKIGFHLAGGFNSYAMSDFNDTEIAPLQAAGMPIDDVKSGANIAAGIRYWPAEHVFLEIGYERLMASTSYGDPTGRIEYNLPANAFLASVGYLFPSRSRFHVGFSGGLGYYSSAGDITLSISGSGSASVDLKTSGPGFHGLILGVYQASPSVDVLTEIGFRYAKAKDIELLGMPTGEDLEWTGVILRAGLGINLPISRGR